MSTNLKILVFSNNIFWFAWTIGGIPDDAWKGFWVLRCSLYLVFRSCENYWTLPQDKKDVSLNFPLAFSFIKMNLQHKFDLCDQFRIWLQLNIYLIWKSKYCTLENKKDTRDNIESYSKLQVVYKNYGTWVNDF